MMKTEALRKGVVADTTCPYCGEIVRSDLLTCWSCGKKFTLSENFTGVNSSDEPPLEEWKSSLDNRRHSEESMREVKREYKKRLRKNRFRKFRKRETSYLNFEESNYSSSNRGKRSKDFLTFFTLIVIITGGGVVYLSEAKQVPVVKAFSYITSEYYRYGFDTVANIDEFTTSTNNYLNETQNSFNQWTDEEEPVRLTPQIATKYSKEQCINLMKLRGMLIALNNATTENLLPQMENSENNRREFVRGCLDSSNS